MVYAKPPIDGGPEKILKYLARYVNRVAISNDRLESIEDGQVTFRYKDYAHGNRSRRMTLPAAEFLERLALHIVPRGFVRVRAFGFLANRHRADKLELIRGLLQVPPPPEPAELSSEMAANQPPRCPHCGQPGLRTVLRTSRPTVPELVAATYPPEPPDTS